MSYHPPTATTGVPLINQDSENQEEASFASLSSFIDCSAPSSQRDPPGEYSLPDYVTYSQSWDGSCITHNPSEIASMIDDSSSTVENVSPPVSPVSPVRRPTTTSLDQGHQMGNAIFSRDVSSLQRMLSMGYDPNSRLDGTGKSALHMAAFMGNIDLTVTLLDYGASVNLVNVYGETPLMIAALYHHAPLVECLLQEGADPRICSKSGDNAEEYAKRRPSRSASSDNRTIIIKKLQQAEQTMLNGKLQQHRHDEVSC